jgi:hypothetical protein
MSVQTTRELNRFIRQTSGLDLSLRLSFAAYPDAEQARAIRRVRTLFRGMGGGGALYHLHKAITVYGGEQRRRAKVSLEH